MANYGHQDKELIELSNIQIKIHPARKTPTGHIAKPLCVTLKRHCNMIKYIWINIIIMILFLTSCIKSPGVFTEISRDYSPDSSRYILKYNYVQGAWDGGRTYSLTVLNSLDSVIPKQIKYSYSSLDFDNIYWKNNDTIIIEEKFTEYLSQGKSRLNATVSNGITFKVMLKDPIDSSYSRKIFYREISPNNKYDLIVYKYVKPENGNYFLNISVVNLGDSIPRFGNFYVSRFDFDCFTDIRWDNASILDIKVSESCYYSFKDYLVKNRPDIKYNVQINDTIKGNIQPYMK